MATPDLTEFHQLAPRPKKPACLIGIALATLHNDDREKAEAALAERAISPGAIEKWFALRAAKINTSAIGAHRAGRCTCADA